MPDPKVASRMSPAEWGAQFRAENPNYFRYKSMNDEDFAHAMRNTFDIENLVDFSKHTDVDKDPAWFNPLQWGTEKPSHVMVNGDITPVGSHIFGEDSKAVYTGARFLSGIPSFVTGVVAGNFDEQSAYELVTQTIKKDGNGNPIFDENGMMDYVDGDGNVYKVTQEDMLERADKLRNKSFLPFGIGPNWKDAEEYLTKKSVEFWTEHNKRMDDYLANNPGVQGYLQWQEDTPWDGFTLKGATQMVHPQMVARAVADMLPSMTVSTLLSGGASLGVQGLKTLAGQQTLKQAAANTSVSGLAQVGAMTLMEGSGQMEEALNILVNDLKMDPGQAVPIASSTALVVGIVNGLLEKLQFNKIAKFGGFDKEAKRTITENIVKSFYRNAQEAGGVKKFLTITTPTFLLENIEEAVIEAMQEMNSLAMNKGLEAGLGTTPEEVISNYKKQFTSFNNLKEMATSPEAMQAFFTGFSGGGGMSASARAGGYLMNKIGGGDKISASYDDSDGKPGIMTNIGGRISKLFTKDKKEAETIIETLEESGASEGLSIPGLGKGIEEISTFKDLLIALADQINNGTSIALEWNDLTPNISRNPEDLTEAQQILVKMNKRFDQFGAHANLVMQDVIDKAGIEVLNEIEDGDIKDLIVEQLKTIQKEKIKAGVKTSLDPEVQEAALEEYLDKQFADDKDFMNMYNDEAGFDQQLQEHLMTLDPEASYQNQKPVSQAQLDKEQVAAERNARVKQVFQNPNAEWSINDLVEAARVAVGKRGIKGLKSFLSGTKGTKNKPGFKGLTKKNLSRLMQAYGIKHSPAMKRGDMIDSLIKKMMGEAVSEINIKAKQAKQETEKPKTKAQKMADFFGDEDTDTTTKEDPIETEATKIQKEIDKLEKFKDDVLERILSGEQSKESADAQRARLDMAMGALRGKLKQLELGTKPEPKVEEKPKKEKTTEEEVKTDTGESITITPTGDEITPDSAVMKGMKDVAADDAATFAKEEEFTEDNYDNLENETEDLSDVINKCGRGI